MPDPVTLGVLLAGGAVVVHKATQDKGAKPKGPPNVKTQQAGAVAAPGGPVTEAPKIQPRFGVPAFQKSVSQSSDPFHRFAPDPGRFSRALANLKQHMYEVEKAIAASWENLSEQAKKDALKKFEKEYGVVLDASVKYEELKKSVESQLAAIDIDKYAEKAAAWAAGACAPGGPTTALACGAAAYIGTQLLGKEGVEWLEDAWEDIVGNCDGGFVTQAIQGVPGGAFKCIRTPVDVEDLLEIRAKYGDRRGLTDTEKRLINEKGIR